ncbi:NUDIX domain-containing protein [Fictibacillus phosphorivorans]|uniref:NUDIX domain-containing protein n=1 Tax=Fictibacillus phosphorivorans TaxID=1221500 RepID=UPI0009EE46DC
MPIHTHRGIYCICFNENGHLLVIEKNGGPYKNRLDLPGGTPEENETEYETVTREVLEETGYSIVSGVKLGERRYELPWKYKQWNLSQHTAVYYLCTIEPDSKIPIADIPLQDSIGLQWVDPHRLKEEWCSPLVWEAVHYVKSKSLPARRKTYHSWEVLKQTLYPRI